MSGLPRWLPMNDTVPTGSEGGSAPGGALQLTTTPPIGFSPPEGAVGTPVFVTPGTVGGLMAAPAAFAEPIGYITAAGTRYAWAKIGLSPVDPMLASSLEIVSDPSAAAYTTAAFAADGTPPAFMYVPLGYVQATGTAPDLVVSPPVNYGSGSIVVAVHLSNLVANELGAVVSYGRSLSYWRVAAP